jgi:hypothetical protein
VGYERNVPDLTFNGLDAFDALCASHSFDDKLFIRRGADQHYPAIQNVGVDPAL